MHRFIYLLVIQVLCFSISCNKDENPIVGNDLPEIEELEKISLDNLDGLPLEVLSINDPRFNLEDNNYIGTISSDTTIFASVNDSTLVFLVPDMESGNYQAEIPLHGYLFQFEVSILEQKEVIDDPNSYVNTFIESIEQDTAYVLDPNLERAKQEFQNLSEQDQLLTARFIQNNIAAMDSLQNMISEFSGAAKANAYAKNLNCDNQCWFERGAQLLTAVAVVESAGVVGTIVGAALGLDLAYSMITGRKKILIVKMRDAIRTALSIAYFPQIKTAELVGEKIDELSLELKNITPKSSNTPVKIVAEREYKISVSSIPYRTINAEDKNYADPVIRRFVSLYLDAKVQIKEIFDITLPEFNDQVVYKPLADLNQVSLSTQNSGVAVTKNEIEDNTLLMAFDHTNDDYPDSLDIELTFTLEHVDFPRNTSIPARLFLPVPLVKDYEFEVTPQINYSANISVTGKADTFEIIKKPSKGSARLSIVSTVYGPRYKLLYNGGSLKNYNDTDYFTYVAINAAGRSDTATVNIKVKNDVIAPVISNVVVDCFDITVSFTDEDGFLSGASYFGSSEQSYPVTIFFRYTGSEWDLAANSYSVEQISGDEFGGVIKASLNNSIGRKCKSSDPNAVPVEWFDDWKIEFTDKYGVKSNDLQFEIFYYN